MVAESVMGHGKYYLGRVCKVVARLVEEYVAEARADDDARDNPGEQAVELLLGVAQVLFFVDVLVINNLMLIFA